MWWHPHGHLLLSDEQVRHCLGQVLHPLAQHSGSVPDKSPQFVLASLVVDALQQVIDLHLYIIIVHPGRVVQPMRGHQVMKNVALLLQRLRLPQHRDQLLHLGVLKL